MLYWRRLNRHLNVDGLPAIAVFNIVLLHMELVWPAIAILKSSRYTNYSFYYYYGFFITYNYLFFFVLVLSGDWNISSLLNLSLLDLAVILICRTNGALERFNRDLNGVFPHAYTSYNDWFRIYHTKDQSWEVREEVRSCGEGERASTGVSAAKLIPGAIINTFAYIAPPPGARGR